MKLDEKGLKKIIKNNLKIDGKLEKIKLLKIGKGLSFDVEIEVTGLLKGKVKKTEKLETKIEIRKRLCKICGKVKGGYYEAIIQIRSDKKETVKEALKIVTKGIEKEGGLITKIEEKNGIDIYFTPKKIINKVIRKLPQVKEMKKSYTLVTRKDGKNLYRNTILVRL